MIPVKMIKLAILATLLELWAGAALSGNPPITLDELAKQSQCIVLGQVNRVRTLDGVHIAEAVVIRTLKGTSGPRVYFMGQPIRSNEVVEAKVGTTYLLFLRSLKSSELPDTAFRSVGVGNLNAFLGKVSEGYGDKIYTIAHSGRGQMAVVKEARLSSVRVRDDEIVLPKQVKTRPVSAQDRDASMHRVLLSDIMDYLNEGPVSR